jgi:type I restriction enzyme S subunit
MKRKGFSTTENTARTEVDAVGSGHSVANTEDLPDGFQMTELGPLPKEWRVVRLGEMVKLTKGRKPDELIPKYQFGALPYLTADYFRNRLPTEWVPAQYLSKLPFCSKEDVVLIWDGSKAGQVFIGLEGVLASTMVRIDPENEIERDYLYFFLLTQFDLLNSKTTGTTIPHVNKEVFRNLPIPLPPLPEQRAIAHVLRTVQRAKEATEGVIAALKELKKSLMQHLFTYGPVPVTEREGVPLQETEIGPIPAHWRVVRLGEVVDVKGGKRLPKGDEFASNPTPYPYIRIVDFKNGSVDIRNLKFLTEEQHILLSRYIITSNDVYISIAGTIGLVGSVPEELSGAHLTENAARLILNTNRLYRQFLVFALQSDMVQAQIQARATKTSQPKLALARVKEIPIPLPPLSEQREIARMLQAVDAKIAAEERRRAALEELFKTLLHALMSGRMRVPHIVGGERSCDSAPDADKLPKSED